MEKYPHESDTEQQEQSMIFTFEKHKDKLIINAQINKVPYQAIKHANSQLDLDKLQKAFQSKLFRPVKNNNDKNTLILQYGLTLIEFKHKGNIQMAELKALLTDLTKKFSHQLEVNEEQNQKISILSEQIYKMNQKLTQSQQLTKKIQSQLAQAHLIINQLELRVKSTEQQLQALAQKNVSIKSSYQKLIKECTHQINLKVDPFTNRLNQNNQKLATLDSSCSALLTQVSKSALNIQSLKGQLQQSSRITYMLKDLAVEQKGFGEMRKNSKIIRKAQQFYILSQFFNDKTIKSIKLLYQASKHNFAAYKFHELCDNISNTIVLCETEYRKKIGGFTPLTWDMKEHEKYKQDESGESFIFSLTHNDKFSLKNKSKTIMNSNDNGPIFGDGTDLGIKNFSNLYVSWGNPNWTYYNINYKQSDRYSFERFCGNPNHKNNHEFRTFEWEVWQVEFE